MTAVRGGRPGAAAAPTRGPVLKTIPHWIDGRPADGTSAAASPVFDPATGDARAEVRRGLEVVEVAWRIPQLEGDYSDQISTDVVTARLPRAAASYAFPTSR